MSLKIGKTISMAKSAKISYCWPDNLEGSLSDSPLSVLLMRTINSKLGLVIRLINSNLVKP